jgi:hypothetical protein
MTQADSVLSTPPVNTSAEPPKPSQKTLAARLAKQVKERERALRRLQKLRTKAAGEIDRLLEFLDAVDDTDVDSAVDDAPCDDTELEGPENGEGELSEPGEPALGSLDGRDQTEWAA